MAIFIVFTENDSITKRHPLSKAIIWSILRWWLKIVWDTM